MTWTVSRLKRWKASAKGQVTNMLVVKFWIWDQSWSQMQFNGPSLLFMWGIKGDRWQKSNTTLQSSHTQTHLYTQRQCVQLVKVNPWKANKHIASFKTAEFKTLKSNWIKLCIKKKWFYLFNKNVFNLNKLELDKLHILDLIIKEIINEV